MIQLKTVSLLLMVISSEVNGWTYDSQDEWHEQYPACGLERQSPIEINSNEVISQHYPVIKYVNYKRLYSVKLINNGHTAQIMFPVNGIIPKISGGPLPKGQTYEFSSLHFHWGANDTVGAEHVHDKHRYSVEVHGVHFNSKYLNLDVALQHEDGVAVLTTFYETLPGEKFSGLEGVSEALQNITLAGTSTKIPNFQLSALYGGIDSYTKRVFYTYHGSLTTPPCAEAATWIIFPKHHSVQRDQVEPFRRLLDEQGEYIVNNFRHLQGINGRKVYYSKS
uniref:Alpha-carbonic anhydrase domain-containing protein n=1 Tax=Stomoxys calcitrans TaxID=35570 RepID=A0A1I8QBL4_STOCA